MNEFAIGSRRYPVGYLAPRGQISVNGDRQSALAIIDISNNSNMDSGLAFFFVVHENVSFSPPITSSAHLPKKMAYEGA